MVMSEMTRKNIPKKVAKKQKKIADGMWDKKLKTLRKTYQTSPDTGTSGTFQPKGRGEENTLNFHMSNVVVGGRLRSHVLG